jgi:hypothetical protein
MDSPIFLRKSSTALAICSSLSLLALSTHVTQAAALVLRTNGGTGDGGNSSSLNSPLTGSTAAGWAATTDAAAPGAAPSSGNTYTVTNGLSLRGPTSGSVTFAGDSLTLDAGSRFLLKAVDATTTINNLILNGGTVDYTGVGTSKTTLAGNILLQSNSVIGGGNDNAVIKTLIVSSTITGTANVTYNSITLRGIVILQGTNTYSGSSTINYGTLLVDGNNSGATGNVTVGSLATLGGTGRIGGATTVNGVLAAGSQGVGVLSFEQSVTLAGTTNSIFEISSGVRGTGYDGVNVTGLLTYDGVLTLTLGALVANGEYDLFSFASQQGSFDSVVFAGGAYTGTFTLTDGVWSSVANGQTFSFSQATGNLTVVPEPNVLGFMILGGLLLCVFGSRSRRSSRIVAGVSGLVMLGMVSAQAEKELWKDDFSGASGGGDDTLTLHRQGGNDYRTGKIVFGDSSHEYTFYCSSPDDPWTQTLAVVDNAVGDAKGLVYTNVTGSDITFGGATVPLDLGWQQGSVTPEMLAGLRVSADYQGGIGFKHSVNLRVFIGKGDQAINLSLFGKASDTPRTLNLSVGEKATPEQLKSIANQMNEGEPLMLGFYLPGGGEPNGTIAYSNIVVTSAAE